MGCGISGQFASPAASDPAGATAADRKLAPLADFLARNQSIKKLVLVRHASAAPRDAAATAAEFGIDVATLPQHANAWTASDLNRPLTEKGDQQAAAAAADWAAAYPLVMAVSSEAVRASATLEVLAPAEVGSIKVLPALHPSKSNAPLCEKMFDTMGYGPLNKFWANAEKLAADGETDPIDGEAVFSAYAADCLCGGGGGGRPVSLLSLLEAAAKAGLPNGNTVMITGHAVFLNAVALGIAKALGASAAQVEQLCGLELGEAEGIELSRGPSGLATVTHRKC